MQNGYYRRESRTEQQEKKRKKTAIRLMVFSMQYKFYSYQRIKRSEEFKFMLRKARRIRNDFFFILFQE
jgi:hypothetical protein